MRSLTPGSKGRHHQRFLAAMERVDSFGRTRSPVYSNPSSGEALDDLDQHGPSSSQRKPRSPPGWQERRQERERFHPIRWKQRQQRGTYRLRPAHEDGPQSDIIVSSAQQRPSHLFQFSETPARRPEGLRQEACVHRLRHRG